MDYLRGFHGRTAEIVTEYDEHGSRMNLFVDGNTH